MDSFRCIHAARLLLDHQMHGHQLQGHQSQGHQPSVAGKVAPDVRTIIHDATLTAFEHVVERALAQDVHCVLISGDSFDPDDRGLRGPAALVRGIGRLAEHDIPVILQAGRPDLWSSWPAGLRFPPNAHRLGAGFATSVSIARDGKLLATIAVGDCVDSQRVSPDPNAATWPSACGAAVSAATAGGTPAPQHHLPRSGWQIHLPMAHLPGESAEAGTIHLRGDWLPVQGLCADESGPHGFTLIEIDATGDPRRAFVPAAPVRWERFPIAVSTETTRDDLLQDMASQLEQTPRHDCEKVWLIAWDVAGAGPLFDRLATRVFRDELLEELAALDPAPGVRIHTHALRMHAATANPSRPTAESDTLLEEPLLEANGFENNGFATKGLAENLAAEFAMRLEERFVDPEKTIHECLTSSLLAGGPWEDKIESLIAELDAGEVAHDARRLAMHWFAGPRFDEQGELCQ